MQRVELIARMFAETGIKDVFRSIYSLVVKYEDRKKIVYLNNKFVPMDVSRWKEKLHCTVNVGVGSGNHQSKMQTTTAIMSILQKLIENGGMGTMVTSENIYNTVSEFIQQSGYSNPDQFITNPANMPPPPPPQPSIDEKIATQKAQIEIQKMQIDTQLATARLKLEKDMATVSLAIKQQELELKKQQMEINKAELALEAVQNRPIGIGPQ